MPVQNAKLKKARRIVRRTRSALPQYESINLRINEIRCVTTTREIDRDEIVVAAIKAEGSVEVRGGKRKLAGKAKAGENHSLGKFKKGDRQKYPKTKVLARFASCLLYTSDAADE